MLARLRSRDDLIRKLPRGGVGVELGVAAGGFSQQILRQSRLGFLYSIDMWAGDRGHDVAQYRFVLERLARYRKRNMPIKMRFEEALPLFKDASFDFIYVDGYAHTGEEGGQTFHDWLPKLKPGGIMAGDDYSPAWPQVVSAVDAFAAQHGLKLNVIPCRDKREDGGVDYPSWYVIKPRRPFLTGLKATMRGLKRRLASRFGVR